MLYAIKSDASGDVAVTMLIRYRWHEPPVARATRRRRRRFSPYAIDAVFSVAGGNGRMVRICTFSVKVQEKACSRVQKSETCCAMLRDDASASNIHASAAAASAMLVNIPVAPSSCPRFHHVVRIVSPPDAHGAAPPFRTRRLRYAHIDRYHARSSDVIARRIIADIFRRLLSPFATSTPAASPHEMKAVVWIEELSRQTR